MMDEWLSLVVDADFVEGHFLDSGVECHFDCRCVDCVETVDFHLALLHFNRYFYPLAIGVIIYAVAIEAAVMVGKRDGVDRRRTV